MKENNVFDSTECFRSGLPANATDDEKRRFVQYRIKVYKKEDDRNGDLAKYFAEDFGSFTSDDFKFANSIDRHGLQDFLRDRRVYCTKGLGMNIAVLLFLTAQKRPTWPDNNRPASHAE